jgi:hypothetical protein
LIRIRFWDSDRLLKNFRADLLALGMGDTVEDFICGRELRNNVGEDLSKLEPVVTYFDFNRGLGLLCLIAASIRFLAFA